MLKFLKEKLRHPTPVELAHRELAEARLAKLEAETAVDYARSVVDYNIMRIERLESFLKIGHEDY
jgi:hypothetical protein